MDDFPTIPLALAASLFEAAVGYPAFVYRLVGHPVTWIGALITYLERRFNHLQRPPASRRMAGVTTLILVMAVVSITALTFRRVCSAGPIGFALLVVVASSLIAQRSLYTHVAAVASALETQGLPEARAAVSAIVGRDPASLDESGVARAAIESLAENFSDGIIAPVLWMAVGGLLGGSLYKAANTADSMIGHCSPRFAAFGWAAARFDDLVNLPASRLAAMLIAIAAAVTGGSSKRSVQAIWRDASRHRSPNAGWPEAAMAGALGLRLAGPRYYARERVDDAFMGAGRSDATAADIRNALSLFRAACVTAWALLLIASLIQLS